MEGTTAGGTRMLGARNAEGAFTVRGERGGDTTASFSSVAASGFFSAGIAMRPGGTGKLEGNLRPFTMAGGRGARSTAAARGDSFGADFGLLDEATSS